jgi:ribonuclease J
MLTTGRPTGLKFMVEHGASRAVFDFGIEHAPGRQLFSMGLQPRPHRALADLVAAGMAPDLHGIYDRWDGQTSVFLTHCHLDHTALVRYLHADVPLYFPAGMASLRDAASASGYLPWRDPPGHPIHDRSRVMVGEIQVEAVAVDHDLPGATGYLIDTPDLSIAFTGDHRWHGLHADVTRDFALAARGRDVLMLEGVTLGSDEFTAGNPNSVRLSEQDVIAGFEPILRQASGLVVVNLYPMNQERVSGLADACARVGRRLLMEPRAARIAGWDGVLSDPAEVARAPHEHCVQLDYESLPSLIDFAPPAGSVHVQSDGAPYGPRDFNWPVLEAWIKRFGLKMVRLCSTGHSWPDDLIRMTKLTSPRVVMPVHSRSPESLDVREVPRFIPEEGRTYLRGDLLGH